MNLEPTGATPRIVPRSEHTISRSAISPNALRVLYRLKDAGYQAFLVGGGVRDLLLGLAPKDFDIATDALPDEVKALFRNCRLIGRRFRLAHVFFGGEIIEVATFRAAHDAEIEPRDEDEEWQENDNTEDAEDGASGRDSPSKERVLDERGRILRDNVYGTIEEDVWRRDFTANALYYNIEDFSVWDFVGGVEDVKARRLKLIGDPVTRYHEDPVRMLRAIRFAAKLGFTIDPSAEEPLRSLSYLLTHVPPARLFDEVLKMFLGGFAARAFELLKEYGLLEPLLPLTHEFLSREPDGVGARLLMLGLEGTDARVAADKSVTPTFLFCLLLYGPIMKLAAKLAPRAESDSAALFDACEEIVRAQQARIMVPRRFVMPMRELFVLQPRFQRREGRRALGLLRHPRFRAAYDLLLLRCAAGGEQQEIADWWTHAQTLPQEEEQAHENPAMPGDPTAPQRTRGPRRRRRRAAKPT